MLLRSSCQAEIARYGADELIELATAKLTEVAKDKAGEWQPKLDVSRTLAGMAKQFSSDAASMGVSATMSMRLWNGSNQRRTDRRRGVHARVRIIEICQVKSSRFVTA
jgi:hypothetical protein